MCVKNDNNSAGCPKTFDGTTSHSTRLSKNNSQVAGYVRAHVGAGHAREPLGNKVRQSTDETTSHSTRLPKYGNQVAGYIQKAGCGIDTAVPLLNFDSRAFYGIIAPYEKNCVRE